MKSGAKDLGSDEMFEAIEGKQSLSVSIDQPPRANLEQLIYHIRA